MPVVPTKDTATDENYLQEMDMSQSEAYSIGSPVLSRIYGNATEPSDCILRDKDCERDCLYKDCERDCVAECNEMFGVHDPEA